MASIALEGVTKRWDGDPAVDDISFSVGKSTLVALLGPSGCGKSTTLRLIAGLDSPNTGIIRIDNDDVTGVAPGRRRISMVFQSYALFPHLTVAENIIFGLKVRRTRAAECKRRLAVAADILGLGPLLDRKPSQLSGGQQQRVALGRAIVSEAPVCLMDEPLSNLDAKLRVEMRREIRELQQKLGITIVYVTHDQLEAMTMADQVILMNHGRIEQDAPPEKLYERPATVFAARFIGTPPMNVLPVPAIGGVPDFLAEAAPRTEEANSLAIGVRPEEVVLAASDSGVSARVKSIEYLGADSIVEATAGSERMLIRIPGRSPWRPGEAVVASWRADATHWFELSSGRRIL
jgi:sn-glycerol 3-phosphate transport system ATP-binding protein